MCFPVESNVGKSDHGLINYECILSRPATFSWETHEYIKLTVKGTEKFNNLISNQDWSTVKNMSPDVDKMVEVFQGILNNHITSCFSWKCVRRKSNNSPWLNDGIRALMKKRIAIFRSEGRSCRWKHLDTSIKESLRVRKGNYFDKESERIKKAGKNGS